MTSNLTEINRRAICPHARAATTSHVVPQMIASAANHLIDIQSMFHMELYSSGEVNGTFITPYTEQTYLAHCDVAQHMEKGMKAQVKVGGGNGNLPSIPGISGQLNQDTYDFEWSVANILIVIILLFLGFSSCLFFFIWRKDS